MAMQQIHIRAIQTLNRQRSLVEIVSTTDCVKIYFRNVRLGK